MTYERYPPAGGGSPPAAKSLHPVQGADRRRVATPPALMPSLPPKGCSVGRSATVLWYGCRGSVRIWAIVRCRWGWRSRRRNGVVRYLSPPAAADPLWPRSQVPATRPVKAPSPREPQSVSGRQSGHAVNNGTPSYAMLEDPQAEALVTIGRNLWAGTSGGSSTPVARTGSRAGVKILLDAIARPHRADLDRRECRLSDRGYTRFAGTPRRFNNRTHGSL